MKLLLVGVLALGSISAFANDCTLNFERYSELPRSVRKIIENKGYVPVKGSASVSASMNGGCAQNQETRKFDNCGFAIDVNNLSFQSSGNSWKSAMIGAATQLPECNR